MATAPSYASNPLAPDIVQISTANTARDGTGTMVALTTGTTSGVVVEQIRVTAVGTTTAGAVRFFLSTDGGTTKRLLVEVLVAANTPSGTNPAWTKVVDDLTGLTLFGTSTILYAATNNAETFNVFNHKAGL
jgi:hypothetical protein